MMGNINKAERATILGALRFYQSRFLNGPRPAPNDIFQIVTDCNTLVALTEAEVDELCEKLTAVSGA